MSRTNHKEPLLRVVKKAEISGFSLALLSLASIVVAFIAGGIFFLMLGINPLNAYAKIFAGAFDGKIAIIATVKIAVPLLITSLGITLAFKKMCIRDRRIPTPRRPSKIPQRGLPQAYLPKFLCPFQPKF